MALTCLTKPILIAPDGTPNQSKVFVRSLFALSSATATHVGRFSVVSLGKYWLKPSYQWWGYVIMALIFKNLAIAGRRTVSDGFKDREYLSYSEKLSKMPGTTTGLGDEGGCARIFKTQKKPANVTTRLAKAGYTFGKIAIRFWRRRPRIFIIELNSLIAILRLVKPLRLLFVLLLSFQVSIEILHATDTPAAYASSCRPASNCGRWRSVQLLNSQHKAGIANIFICTDSYRTLFIWLVCKNGCFPHAIFEPANRGQSFVIVPGFDLI